MDTFWLLVVGIPLTGLLGIALTVGWLGFTRVAGVVLGPLLRWAPRRHRKHSALIVDYKGSEPVYRSEHQSP